jgi:hypothetical protein
LLSSESISFHLARQPVYALINLLPLATLRGVAPMH